MKRIIKGKEPQQLLNFKNANRLAPQNLSYINLWKAEREPVKKSLLNEQGFLCAYTLKRIDFETCHIEHIKPEELCRKQIEQGEGTLSDLDYKNMVACFPKSGVSGVSKEKYFGAIKKGDWWAGDGKAFVSPLDADCENHFTFNSKGEVHHTTRKGKITIDVLALNHRILVNDRKRAIDEFINRKPLSKAHAERAIREITQRRKDGFYEYCVPVKFALQEHIEKLKKKKIKDKAIAKQKRGK